MVQTFSERFRQLRQEYDRLQAAPDPTSADWLETQLKDLDADLDDLSDQELKTEVFTLLDNLKRLRLRSGGQREAQMATDLKTASIHIRAGGTLADLQDALGLIRGVLEGDPRSTEACTLLKEIHDREPSLSGEVTELLEQATAPNARELLAQIRPGARPAGKEGARERPPDTGEREAGSRQAQGEIAGLLALLTKTYYEGDYQGALKLCAQILNLDSRNQVAREYQQKAEYNIEHGVVLDAHLPMEARVAYNKGISARRAGLYKEAEEQFSAALRSAKDKGVQSWKDCEDALLNIENLKMALRLREEGDEAVRRDRWDDALQRYESALDVVDEPRTRRKYDVLSKVNSQYRQISIQFNMMGGNLTDMARNLQEQLAALGEARQEFPESPKLSELQTTLQARARDVGSKLAERGATLLEQAENALSIGDRSRYLEEAVKVLEAARNLKSGEIELDEQHTQAQNQLAQIKEARTRLDGVKKLLANRVNADLDQARVDLESLADYPQDPTYRSLVNSLQKQLLEEAQAALDAGRPGEAQAFLGQLHGKPFNVLGRSRDLAALETRVNQMRQAQLTRRALTATGFFIAALLLLLATRSLWKPALFPGPTPTPTPTPIPTLTLTPTETLVPTATPTATATPTPTATPTATAIPTATATSTPAELCRGVTKPGEVDYNVRAQPQGDSPRIGILNRSFPVRIIDQTRDKDGNLWYKVDYGGPDAIQQGWVLAAWIIEASSCPRLQ